jgi:hypothetical protein
MTGRKGEQLLAIATPLKAETPIASEVATGVN